MSSFLEPALKFAEQGLPVFPSVPQGKEPLTKHGVKDSSTDAKVIQEWSKRWPNANIAMACGKPSGLYALDVDVRDNVNGFKSLEGLPPLPPTIRQDTPSGGAHFLFRAENPPANKNGFLPGVDLRGDGYYIIVAPSIGDNGRPYRWTPGHSPWDIQAADWPEFLRPPERLVLPSPKLMLPQLPRTPAPMPLNDDTLRHASRYLSECEAAVQTMAGHDKLLWACGAMTHGCGLSESEAYSILANEYNPRCVPPWNLDDPKDEKDFRRKITESIRKPPDKPRGWILNDPAYATPDTSSCVVDFAALMQESQNIAGLPSKPASVPAVKLAKGWGSAAQPSKSHLMPDELRHPTGFLGLYVAHCREAAPYHNTPLAIAGGLALLSAVTGRKIVGPSGIPVNVYILGLALSGSGKNQPRTLNAKILEAAGGIELLAERFASAAGIEDRLAALPVALFQPDEVDPLIDAMEKGRDGHSLEIASLLNQLYTSSGGVYVTRVKAKSADNSGRPRVIIRPHLVLHGSALPDLYYRAVGNRLLKGGFIARTTVFEADPRCRGRCQGAGPPIPERLIEEVRYWLNFVPPGTGDIAAVCSDLLDTPLTIPATAAGQRALGECRSRADEHYTVAERTADAGAAAVWSRVYEQTEKIATLYAVSENHLTPQIDKPMVDWAEGVVTWSAKRSLALAAEFSADSPFAEACKRLLRTVSGFGGRVNRRDVSRKMKEPVKTLDDYVKALVDQGRLAVHVLPATGHGKLTVEYEAIQNETP